MRPERKTQRDRLSRQEFLGVHLSHLLPSSATVLCSHTISPFYLSCLLLSLDPSPPLPLSPTFSPILTHPVPSTTAHVSLLRSSLPLTEGINHCAVSSEACWIMQRRHSFRAQGEDPSETTLYPSHSPTPASPK